MMPEARAAWRRLRRAWLDLRLARAEDREVVAAMRVLWLRLRIDEHDAGA